MPSLKNARHEIFAQEIVKGVSGREAYKIAGFSVSNDNAADASASRLLRDVKEFKRALRNFNRRRRHAP
jgi:hypothetical protein